MIMKEVYHQALIIKMHMYGNFNYWLPTLSSFSIITTINFISWFMKRTKNGENNFIPLKFFL